MRLFFVVFLCAVACLAGKADAQRVDDLANGIRIRVEMPGIDAVQGTFQSATPDSVKLVSDGIHRVFPRRENVAFFRSAGVNRTRSALVVGSISGLVGAVAGGAIGSMSFKPCDSREVYDCGYVPNTRSRAAVFGAAVFGASSLVIGGLVGALRAGDTWIPLER